MHVLQCPFIVDLLSIRTWNPEDGNREKLTPYLESLSKTLRTQGSSTAAIHEEVNRFLPDMLYALFTILTADVDHSLSLLEKECEDDVYRDQTNLNQENTAYHPKRLSNFDLLVVDTIVSGFNLLLFVILRVFHTH